MSRFCLARTSKPMSFASCANGVQARSIDMRNKSIYPPRVLDYNMKLDRDGGPVHDPEGCSLWMFLIGQRNNDLSRFRIIRSFDVLPGKFGWPLRVRVVNRNEPFACPAKVTKNPDQFRRVHLEFGRDGRDI